jgi:hypothetical protein
MGLPARHFAREIGVSARTFRDWKRGKYTIPYGSVKTILQITDSDNNEFDKYLLDDWWYTHLGAPKGGAALFKKRGSPGTLESRIRGGQASYAQRKADPRDIFAKSIALRPPRNRSYAEFIGIMIGDGCITKYQISVYLSSLVDSGYVPYVTSLIASLFMLGARVSSEQLRLKSRSFHVLPRNLTYCSSPTGLGCISLW